MGRPTAKPPAVRTLESDRRRLETVDRVRACAPEKPRWRGTCRRAEPHASASASGCLLVPIITGQGHTGVYCTYREKKKVKVCTPEYCKFKLTQYIFYICTQYNDYYQIINEVAQLRQHKQRLNDLRTQLG